MSHKLLIIAAVVAIVLAAFAAPVLASPLQAENAFPVQAASGSGPSSDGPVWPLRIQPEGGCENGGAGGCPISG
jgi:hypothetical protein